MSDDGLTAREVLSALAPLVSVANTLRRFGQNPVAFVSTIISLYIVGSLLSLGQYIVGSILAVFDFIAGAFALAGIQIRAPFVYVGNALIGAIGYVQVQINSVLVAAGPFAPVLVVGFAAVSLWLLYELVTRLSIGLIGEFPSGSTILSLLGLD